MAVSCRALLVILFILGVACAVEATAPLASMAPLSSPATGPLPVVLMHGVNTDIDSMANVVDWIHAEPGLENLYVKNVEIGNGAVDSIFMSMNDQVADFCKQMAADPKLQNGFNLIGFSQGTLVTRGYIQRCNSPPVYNYISWAGPQDGQFGIPYVGIDWIDELVGATPYADWVQETFSFAQYWKDPFQMTDYLAKSLFLPDLNNELPVKNQTYKAQILSLNTLLLIYSPVDDVINPPESGWFGFYGNDSMKHIIPLFESPQYTGDWLGFKTLNGEGKLQLHNTNCTHTGHTDDTCKQFFDQYTAPLLQEVPSAQWLEQREAALKKRLPAIKK